MGTTWHSSTAKNIKGRAWIYTQSRWSPRRCHDLEPQPWISSPIILTLSFLPSVFQTFQPSLAVPDFKSPWFLLLLHQPSASLLPSIFFRLPAPQSFPCRLPLNTKSFLKWRFQAIKGANLQVITTLQLPLMSLPSCSSEQPLLVVFYFGGAHLAATFSIISAQNCTHLISRVNLLPVCRSSKQQHFCVVHEHFRTSVGHCWESCIWTTGP